MRAHRQCSRLERTAMRARRRPGGERGWILMNARTKVVWGVSMVAAFALLGRGMSTGASAAARGRSPVPERAIDSVIVIDLENENYSSAFGPDRTIPYD